MSEEYIHPMEYTVKDVAKLREMTGAGFADCKNALTEATTLDQAVKILDATGQKRAQKVKSQERETRQGVIQSYVHHGGNLGVLLELNCSTDFVARSDEFQALAHDLALQIAGRNPRYVTYADVPPETIEQLRAQAASDPEVQARPEQLRAQIVAGKVKKQLSEQILLEQPFVKDEAMTVGKLIDNVIRQTGENIVVRRFARFALGE